MAKIYDKVKFFDHVKIIPSGISNPPTPPPVVPLYALSRSVASTNEGTTVTFTLSTANVANGTNVPYVINGISQEDLVSGSLNGNFVVNNSSSSLSFTIAEDTLTEGTETLTLSAADKTASVSILDTSRAPIYIADPGVDYKLSRSVASANEGSVVAYTLSSWFFGVGDVVPYTIGGISQEDLVAGSLTGNFVFANTETATLSFTIASDLLTEGSEVMTLSAIEKASSITIVDTSVTPEFPPAYKLIRSAASTNEGGTISFTLSTVNVASGTFVPYKITGISQSDLYDGSVYAYGGSIEDYFVIQADGTSTLQFILAEDLLTEGTETMTISAAGKTASISILDTSLSPQYTLARSAASTDEGTTVTYTLSSDTALDGTLVPYTVTGINAADLTAGSLTGNFTVVSKAASVSFTLANDLLMEGPETMTISAKGRTSSILINDTSLNPLFALSRSAASTNEGTTVTYTLSTARVGEGAQVPYKITGLSAEDLSSGLLEGAFVVDGAGFATLSLTLANDQLTEGTETMTLSAGNRTSAISILDTSKAPVYTITRSTSVAGEGITISYRLSAAFVEVGTAVPYVITGISQEDLSFGSLEGNFVLGSSFTNTISATLASDLLTEGTETMTITVADKSSSITVNDTSLTPEVVLLLAGDGIDGANNNPTDVSSNNFAVTRVGTSTLANTSPFAGNGSIYLDGSGDYLTVASHSNLEFGTGDFTIECWIYKQTDTRGTIISNVVSGTNTNYFLLACQLDGSIRFQIRAANDGGQWFSTTPSNSVPNEQWSHVVATRESGAMKVFVNGEQMGTMTIIQPAETPERSAVSNSTNLLQRTVVIGAFRYTGFESYFNSYISNLRIINGVALYTSNFSVPTTSLTNISNTALLLNTPAPGIIDSSSNNPLIITAGDSKITTSVKKYGSGSLRFDGSGDYLQIPISSDLTLGIADFTIEFWCNFTEATASNTINRRILSHGTNASNRMQLVVENSTTRGNEIGSIFMSTNATNGASTNTAVNDGNWHHVAFARQSGVLRTFVNGVLKTTVNSSTNFNDSSTSYFIGAYADGASGFYNGFLDDFRITKGVALYTSDFTSPTGPLTINI